MGKYTCARVHMCDMCRGQRTIMGVVSRHFTPWFWGLDHSLAWNLSHRLGWLDSEPQDLISLLQNAKMLPCLAIFTWVLGIKSDSQAQTASALPTKLSPRPHLFFWSSYCWLPFLLVTVPPLLVGIALSPSHMSKSPALQWFPAKPVRPTIPWFLNLANLRAESMAGSPRQQG